MDPIHRVFEAIPTLESQERQGEILQYVLNTRSFFRCFTFAEQINICRKDRKWRLFV